MTADADLAGGDVGDQVVAVLDLASVDRDDDVARLDAGLGRAAVRRDTELTITPPFAKPYIRLTAEDGAAWKLMPMEPRTTLCSGPISML